MRRGVWRGTGDYSITISKEQVMAPVGHISSQSVHQWHSCVSMTVIIFSIKTKAPQRQTLTHNPQPLHFSNSTLGMSVTMVTPVNY